MILRFTSGIGYKLLFAYLIGLVGVSGCTLSYDWIWRARVRAAVLRGEYGEAVSGVRRVIGEDPNSESALMAAREGARIAHLDLRDYGAAADFYSLIVRRSPFESEKQEAQRFLAQIYFENLEDFARAILEYERLLAFKLSPEEKFKYRLNLAKCHVKLNNLSQALAELELLLGSKLSSDQGYDIRMLKANILLANKQLAEAVAAWESILAEFPQRATKDKVPLSLLVALEDLQEYDRAIALLESIKYPDQAFVKTRIRRLREKQANLPGARGWRK